MTHTKNKQVLIVEDDFFIAISARDALSCDGNEVVVANSVSEAIDVIEDRKFDCAIMDFNLGDETIMPVAEKLEKTNTPYAIVSAADRNELKRHFGNLTNVFRKPADYQSVIGKVLA